MFSISCLTLTSIGKGYEKICGAVPRRSTDINPAVRTKKPTINESMYAGIYFAVAMPKLVMEDQIAGLRHDLCNSQSAVLVGP